MQIVWFLFNKVSLFGKGIFFDFDSKFVSSLAKLETFQIKIALLLLPNLIMNLIKSSQQ